ncbi:hypothetical protein WK50_00645 [Burkholderia ubonensis]|nr:hypothetical protein WK50_00645 [Burkholderia ubonensis]
MLLVVFTLVDSEFTPLCAVLIPTAAEVDRLVTLLFVAFTLVDSEFTPLCAVLIPVELEVDRLVTLLFVVLSPVDSELTPLCAVLIPVELEVDRLVTLPFVAFKLVESEKSCPPFTASVEPDATFPLDTLTILRCSEPLPTLTTFAAPPSVLLEPSATEFVPVAVAP